MKGFCCRLLLAATLMVTTQAAASEPAYIQVKSPPGVRIFVDGTLKGVTARDVGGLIIEGLAPGRHTVRAQKEGFQPQVGTVVLTPGQVLEYVVKPFKQAIRISQEGQTEEETIEVPVGSVVIQSLPIQCRVSCASLDIESKKSRGPWLLKPVLLTVC